MNFSLLKHQLSSFAANFQVLSPKIAFLLGERKEVINFLAFLKVR